MNKYLKGPVLIIASFLIAISFNGNGFTQDQQKTVYGVLLDNTGSMLPQMTDAKNLGKEVVNQIYKKGSVSLFAFKHNERIAEFDTLISFSQDQAKLEKKIDGISVAIGKTTLYGAIDSSVKKLGSPKTGNSIKVLVLITDGGNKSGDISREEILAKVEAANIKVYIIAFPEPVRAEPNISKKGKGNDVKEREDSKAFLETLTKRTGGRLILPKPGDLVRDTVKRLLAE